MSRGLWYINLVSCYTVVYYSAVRFAVIIMLSNVTVLCALLGYVGGRPGGLLTVAQIKLVTTKVDCVSSNPAKGPFLAQKLTSR